jgi:hypothetical protein
MEKKRIEFNKKIIDRFDGLIATFNIDEAKNYLESYYKILSQTFSYIENY